MFLIPAIDIIDGKCVRLTQGDYSQKKIYNENPLEVAKEFEANGLLRLHLVDLDGAKAKKIINHKVLEKICTHTRLHVDFGGGVQDNENLKIAFECGAKQVTGGSVAFKNPQLFEQWLTEFGGEKIILGADCQNEMIAISGWEEKTTVSVFDFIKDFQQKGAKYAICTDISKDGLLAGTSIELYKKIIAQMPDIQLIASGGVTAMDDIKKLTEIGCFGAIIGKAIYEGRISVKELGEFVASNHKN